MQALTNGFTQSVRAGIKEVMERNGENEEQSQAGR